MSQIFAYEREPYRAELDVEVLETGEDGGRPFAVTDDTILYPEGGGQPADHGRLGAVAVTDVQRAGGAVRHYLEAPAEKGPQSLTLDWPRRYDHMQQHTAQHLVTVIASDRFGWRTTSYHLRPEICDIELDVPSLPAADLETLEDLVVAEIRADRPITARRVPARELAGLDVRSRGLPGGHRGDVRLVEIAGLDLNTCGGTHVKSTGEIETLKLLGTESLRGGTRLAWIAGERVRRRLAAHEDRNAELRRLLDTADEKFVEVMALKLTQLRTTTRQKKALESRLAQAVTERLASQDGAVADVHFDDAGPGFLQQIARRFNASAHPGVVLLTATGDQGAFFVVAAGGDSRLDVQDVGRRVASVLEGRGGGSGGVFQGKAKSLKRRAAAVAALGT